MQDRNATIALYAAGATVAALGLAYILGPSIFPDDAGYRDTRVGGVVGLSNPANDCFINSVLQALAGVEGLKEYLEKLQHEYTTDSGYIHVEDVGDEKNEAGKHAASKVDDQRIIVITSALSLMLEKLNERPAYRKTISARDFISTLEHVFGSHINRRQQDAQEFLQVVLEKLDDEHLAVTKSTGYEQSNKNALLPIAGSISSQITCLTCNFQPEPNVSSFLTLTLNVPHDSSSTTLDACLDGLLKVETIEDYMCDGCLVASCKDIFRDELERSTDAATKDKLATMIAHMDQDPETWASQGVNKARHSIMVDGSTDPKRAEAFLKRFPPRRRIQKHTSIAKFPPVLAIHLSRSVFDPSAWSMKNNAKVEFPENLVLGSISEKRQKYRLSAMITHRGGHNSGHYETFRRFKEDEIPKDASTNVTIDGEAAQDEVEQVKAESVKDKNENEKNKARRRKSKVSDRWWRISDDKTSECRTKEMLNMQKEAYLLFYELKQR